MEKKKIITGIRKIFNRNYISLYIGGGVVLIIILSAIFAPWITPYDPIKMALTNRLKPPGFISTEGLFPHIFGTDQLGRDLFTRIIFGARISLIVGILSVFVSSIFGTVFGLLAGYFGGKLDSVIMRFTDIQMSLPFILIALLVVSLLGPSLRNIVIVFAITSWYIYVRMARASTLSFKNCEWVEAARSIGASNFRIMRLHVFPHIINPLLVLASFDMSRIIVTEAALGFLGLGVPPPTPTWGNMLSDGREYIQDAWWISTFPGIALMILVLGINTLGDSLRDLLDPTLRKLSEGPTQMN